MAANAIDGDINTRWSLGHGTTSGDWFQIDLGSPTSFNKIVFDTGVSNSFDYVTKYQIYVSDDGADGGSAIASGSGGIGKTAVTLPTRTAQYVRIVSTAASGFWWAIGDIEVYGPSRGTGSITAPTAVSNGLQLKTWTSRKGEQVTVVFNGTTDSKSFKMSTDGSYTYTLPGGTSAMFTTKKLSSFPSPTFSDLKPERGMPRSKFTIRGSGFGDAQGLGTVHFGSSYAEIDTWSDTSISAYVPKGLPAGKVRVSVKGASGADAGGSSFDVMDLGSALPRTGWTATASDASQWDAPGNMLDGNPDTRYSSGTGQYDGLWIHVDMGQTQTFDKTSRPTSCGSARTTWDWSCRHPIRQTCGTWHAVGGTARGSRPSAPRRPGLGRHRPTSTGWVQGSHFRFPASHQRPDIRPRPPIRPSAPALESKRTRHDRRSTKHPRADTTSPLNSRAADSIRWPKALNPHAR